MGGGVDGRPHAVREKGGGGEGGSGSGGGEGSRRSVEPACRRDARAGHHLLQISQIAGASKEIAAQELAASDGELRWRWRERSAEAIGTTFRSGLWRVHVSMLISAYRTGHVRTSMRGQTGVFIPYLSVRGQSKQTNARPVQCSTVQCSACPHCSACPMRLGLSKMAMLGSA